MKGSIFVVFATILIASTADALPQPAPSAPATFPPAGMQFEKPFLDYLLPALKQTGKPARIDVNATCPISNRSVEDTLNGNIGFDYQSVNVDLSPSPLTGMGAVRHLLQSDPEATVRQDPSGLVRITIGNVQTAILQTKISRLELSKYAQYTALSAVDELTLAPDLIEAEQRTHIRSRNHLVDHIVGWGAGPHLPSLLQGVTFDQALDAVAKTFNGIIIYGACRTSDGGWYTVHFVYDGHG